MQWEPWSRGRERGVRASVTAVVTRVATIAGVALTCVLPIEYEIQVWHDN